VTAIFTNTFKTALQADATLMTSAQVEMVMFSTAAALTLDEDEEGLPSTTSSPYAAIDTIAGLEAQLGWGPSIAQTVTVTLLASTGDPTTYYALMNDTGFKLPGAFPTSLVKAVAFVYKGPKPAVLDKVMFVTDTPVSTGTVMHAGDGIIAQDDPAAGRIFFSWAADSVIEGPLVRIVGPAPFEPARTQHLWVYPQRMNMIANPSFEEDTDYWRSDGAKSQITTKIACTVRAATLATLTVLSAPQTVDGVALIVGDRVLVKDQTSAFQNGVYVVASGVWTRATDADSATELEDLIVYVKNGSQRATAWQCTSEEKPIVVDTTPLVFVQAVHGGGGNFAGHFAGKVVESNMFPLITRYNETGWTLQTRVRSDGEVKIGFITWVADFAVTITDWGHPEEIWLPNNGWLSVRTCRRIGEASTGMLRVETQGTYIDLDLVCVEFGTMPANYGDWPYFDGDSLYGMIGDFSWYERDHKSYSCWYNDREAVFGRLFAWNVSSEDTLPGGVFTDREAATQGLAHQWVPAGTPLMSHIDILFPEDPKNALPPVTGSVLVRRVNGSPQTGVSNPWIAREATAGIPGTWGPVDWTAPVVTAPATVLDLQNSTIKAYPISRWTTGQYVQTLTTGEAGRAWWTGDRWEPGTTP
jgi:hypothetical protein